MTGYTVHTGSTVKFSTGWDTIFGGEQSGPTRAKKKSAKPQAKKPVGKKKARRSGKTSR